jgi:PAS domain S-box-containing protein
VRAAPKGVFVSFGSRLENSMRAGSARQFETERKLTRVMSTALSKQPMKGVASDEVLRAIIDACVSNVAVLDESGSILYASKAWSLFEQQEREPASFAPHYFENCKRFTGSEFDEDTNISLADDIQHILFGKLKEFHRQYYYELLSPPRPFMMHAARLNLPGSTFRVLVTHEEMVSPFDDLKQSNERLIELLGTTSILACEYDFNSQRFTQVGEHAVKLLGFPLTAWFEPGFLAAHIHADDRQRVLAVYQRQTRISKHFDLTFRLLAHDGHVVWVQNVVSVDSGNKMHGFMIDISERKRAEDALKDLGGRLIAAQEDERRRVARELHDDFNQRLAILSIELQQLGEEFHDSLKLYNKLHNLQTQTQEIAFEIHRLSYKLHPSKLDHLGLTTALRSLCDEISDSRDLKVQFQQSGPVSVPPKEITLCLFRIAQEGLRNCVKHSGANLVRVVLAKNKNSIRLSVSDNGCGFDTKSGLMEKGLGFISMKERLHLLGGELAVYSKPQHGTRIDVSVPLIRKVEATLKPELSPLNMEVL